MPDWKQLMSLMPLVCQPTVAARIRRASEIERLRFEINLLGGDANVMTARDSPHDLLWELQRYKSRLMKGVTDD